MYFHTKFKFESLSNSNLTPNENSPHENLILEIKLIPGVVRVFTSVCLLFLLYVQLPNVDDLTTCLLHGSTGA
jgi:uncharacterized BrkB/YihY/UPF0761 family membrane protein